MCIYIYIERERYTCSHPDISSIPSHPSPWSSIPFKNDVGSISEANWEPTSLQNASQTIPIVIWATLVFFVILMFRGCSLLHLASR